MKKKTLAIGALAATSLLAGGWAVAQSAHRGHGGMRPMMNGMDHGMMKEMGPGMMKGMGHEMGPGMKTEAWPIYDYRTFGADLNAGAHGGGGSD